MGRLLRKKTESQKNKLKLKSKNELQPGTEESTVSTDASTSRETAKRYTPSKKVESQKKTTPSQVTVYYQKISQFLREVKAELKKVVWPPKNQAVTSTVVVIVLVIIVSSLLGFFDLILNSLIQMVLK